MNKQEPADDDTRPFDEWQKYSKFMIVTDEKGDQVELEYVSKEDVQKILLGVFIGQKDQKRIDPADLVLKYQD